MVTRKSIGDHDGFWSLYVVEVKMYNGCWIQYWNPNFCSDKYIEAVRFKWMAYRHCKLHNKKWTRKDFRISLYVRAEEQP